MPLSQLEGGPRKRQVAVQKTQRESDVEVAESMAGERPSTIYQAIRLEGEHELSRGFPALWWSGVAAGLALSTSVICKGFLVAVLPDAEWSSAVSSLGYTVGFLLVILGRMQLFTENTITPILSLFLSPTRDCLVRTARLWAIVFAANLVGCIVAAASLVYAGIAPPPQMDGIMEVSREYAELTAAEHFLYGMPAGFLIASLVWIMPRLTGAAEVLAILIITYMIGLGGLSHVIAGSTELIVMVMSGELAFGIAAMAIVASFTGNVVGGTGLFATLTYAQVREEL